MPRISSLSKFAFWNLNVMMRFDKPDLSLQIIDYLQNFSQFPPLQTVIKRNMTDIVEAPKYYSDSGLTKEQVPLLYPSPFLLSFLFLTLFLLLFFLPLQAMEDLQLRINHYKKRYEEVGTCDYDKSYIKVIDVGRKIITNRISGNLYFPMQFCTSVLLLDSYFSFKGFVLSRILCFIMNLHSIPRPIYLCRHGESEYNVLDQLGGDPHLSEKVCFYITLLIFLLFLINIPLFFSFRGGYTPKDSPLLSTNN